MLFFLESFWYLLKNDYLCNMEKWRDIPGFEGFYQASDLGRIKSLTRNYKYRGYNVFYLGEVKEKILKQSKDQHGYLNVKIYKCRAHQIKGVHQLVALAFPEICGEPFPGAEVNHLVEDKTNNVATNLRFCSHIANCNWGTAIERTRKTNTNGKCSKPVLQYTKTGEFIKEYPSQNEVQRQTGFHRGYISSACTGKRKSAYGYVWKYKNPSV